MSMYELDDAIRIRDEIKSAFENADEIKRDFDETMTRLSQLDSRAQRLYSDEYVDEFVGELDDIIQMLSDIVDGIAEVRSELEGIEV